MIGPSYSPFEMLAVEQQIVVMVLFVWSLAIKGVALWKSARLGQKWWFVGLLVISSIGLLELVYLCFFQKGEKNVIQKWKEKKSSKRKK